MFGNNIVRHILFTLMVGLCLLAGPVLAQGLPGGPTSTDSLISLTKYPASCDKCRPQAQAYHQAVDVYDAARAIYEKQVLLVHSKVDPLLESEDRVLALEAEYEALKDESYRLLLNPEVRAGSYEQERAEEDEAETFEKLKEARGVRSQNQGALEDALYELDRARAKALAQMRKARKLLSALFKCEAECTVQELDLDEPKIAVGPTGSQGLSTSKAPDLPEVENFQSVVAKCAQCQPLAEQVNTFRSKRRSFAVDAEWVSQSLDHNRKTLERLRDERKALLEEERAVYDQVMELFNKRQSDAEPDTLDKIFDAQDRDQRNALIRAIADKLSANALDVAGFEVLVNRLEGALADALAGYANETIKLEAAQKKLAECEKDCPIPAVVKHFTPGFVLNPDYPQPEEFIAVIPKCLKCLPIAEALNKALTDRYVAAFDIQEVVARIDRYEAEEAELEDKSREISDKIDAEGRDLATSRVSAERRIIFDDMLKYSEQKTKVDATILQVRDDIAGQKEVLEQLIAQHEALTLEAAKLQQKLAACEETCTENFFEIGSDRVNLFAPDYPLPKEFIPVRAKCIACQNAADHVNAMLEEQYKAAIRIQAATFRIAQNQDALNTHTQSLKDAEAEEAKINDVLLSTGDAKAREAAQSALQDIDFKRHALEARIKALNKVIAADKQERADATALHSATINLVIARRADLAECEKKQCVDDDDGTKIGLGNPATPVGPVGDFVTTDCEPCEVIASTLNDVVGSAITAQKQLNEEKAALKKNQTDLAAKKARVEEIDARQAQLSELMLRAGDEATRQVHKDAFYKIDEERRDLLDETPSLEAEIEEQAAAVAASEAIIAKFKEQADKLRAELAECEKQCADDDGTKIGLGNPATPVGPDGPAGSFVSTDCEPCEVIASTLNDVVGSAITAQKQLDIEKAALEKNITDLAAKKARLEAVETRQGEVGVLMLRAGDNQAVRDKHGEEFDTLENERRALRDQFPILESEIEDQAVAVAASEAIIAKLKEQANKLRTELAECEKQCADAGNDTKIGLGNPVIPVGPDGPAGSFVSTDCEPCLAIASTLNDIVGSAVAAAKELNAATTGLTQNQADLKAKKARLEKVEERESDVSVLMLRARDNEAAQKTYGEEFDILEGERRTLLAEIPALEDAVTKAQSEVASIQARINALKRMADTVRAELVECEKQCANTDNDTKIGLGNPVTPVGPDGPAGSFASTDCEPCEVIVSTLNDVVGSAITAQKQLDSEKATLEKNQADLAAKKARIEEIETRELELSELMLRADDEATRQVHKDAFYKIDEQRSDLLDETPSLEAEIEEQAAAVAASEAIIAKLKEQANRLREKLAECEKQCAEEEEDNNQVGLNGTTPSNVVPIANFSLSKSQPQICRAGQACDFNVTLTNTGTDSYSGPIFLSETMNVQVKSGQNWFCSRARSGQSVCHITAAGVGSGQSLSAVLTASLPRNVGNGAQNCVAMTHPGSGGNQRDVVQAIQLGLAARNINVGSADGLIGPKTRAGIQEFSQIIGDIENQEDLSQVYAALYGLAPFESQGSTATACVDISIVREKPKVVVVQPDEPKTSVPVETTQPKPKPNLPSIVITVEPQRHGNQEENREQNNEHNTGLGGVGIGLKLPGFGTFNLN